MLRRLVATGALVVLVGPFAPSLLAEEHVSKEHGFAVEVPEGWVVSDGAQVGGYVLNAHPAEVEHTIAVQVKVIPSPGIADDEAFRAALLAGERGKPEHQEFTEVTIELAGAPRAGIEVETASSGATYRVRQAYVVRDDEAFIVQAFAPADRFDEHESAFARWFGSFRLFEPEGDADADEQRRLRRIAARCGQELDWAASWDEAAERARAENRLVLAYARLQPGFAISDSMMTGPFHDPAIVDLIRTRFAPVRLTKEARTPLHRRDVYGLSGTSFGVSLLACRPDGEVVRETFAAEPTAVWEFLLDALARAPEAIGVDAPTDEMHAVHRAADHVARGELDAALAAVDGESALISAQMKARALELLRRGDEAIAVLHGRPGPELDLLVDEGRIHLRRRDTEQAAEVLREFLNSYPDHPRLAEALVLLGDAELRTGGAEYAEAHWRRVIEEEPKSRWAAKAAASLTSTVFQAIGGGEPYAWPAEDVLASVRPVPYERLEAADAPRAERDAVRYLLGAQRANGSWVSPSEIRGSGDFDFAHPFIIAVTTIAVRGLLPHRDDPAVSRAIGAGLGFLARQRERKGEEPPVVFMDYTMWSRAYELLLLADALEVGVVHGETTIPVMDALVEALRGQQQTNGGWSYYISGDLQGTPVHQSISFTTAAVTSALLRAAEVGADVPTAMTDRALDALDAMRNENRTFEYFLHAGARSGGRNTGRPGAAGRGPLCEVTRLRGGRVGLDALRGALDVWVEHRAALAAEAGKALMHSGDQGQGCHYILFDYSWVAEAISTLPTAEQARYRDALLETLLATRTADGANLDAPFLGRAYGAGMALRVYGLLRAPESREF